MAHKLPRVFALAVFGFTLMLIDPMNFPDSVFTQAEARIGRPLTPLSYAGVARRTTRRSVYAASTVYVPPPTTTTVVVDNSYEQQQLAQAQQDVAVAQQQAALPVGATLPSLPTGCGSSTVNNQSYFNCTGNWYRPAMQSGNIVYMVVADPRSPDDL